VEDELLATAFGVVALFIFYSAVRSEWPDNYMTVDTNGLEYAIVSHPLRYLAFRFLPVYLVCLFVAVLLDRGQHDPVAVLVICAVHACWNSGRAVVGLLRAPEGQRQAPLLIMHVGVAAGVFLAGFVALWTRSDLAIFVPSIHELGATLWTAAFAAVLGVYVLNKSRVRSNLYTTLQQSRARIDTDLFAYADEQAALNGADAAFVKAIMVVENLQRPRWFRDCERIKGIVFKRGTYGIMQVAADHPVSDRESIELAVRTRLAGWVVPTVEYNPGHPTYDYNGLKELALRYNPADSYAMAVQNAYGLFWRPI
jgi:hypothetical protein